MDINFPLWELYDSPRMTESSKVKFNLKCNYIFILNSAVNVHPLRYKRGSVNTGLFISPAGISELDCATTKAAMAERSISIGR